MSIKNARILGVRLDEKTTARIAVFEQKTHIEAVSLARASLLAALDYFDATGSLSLPLQISPAAPTEEKIAQQNNADQLKSKKTAQVPDLSTPPPPPPTPPVEKTHENVVYLPPSCVVATLLHDTLDTPPSTPVTERRSEARYEKKRRKA